MHVTEYEPVAAFTTVHSFAIFGKIKFRSAVNVPVIASGGAGKLEHLAEVLDRGKADAVLAASIFHFGTYTIAQAKEFLSKRGIPVRPVWR